LMGLLGQSCANAAKGESATPTEVKNRLRAKFLLERDGMSLPIH